MAQFSGDSPWSYNEATGREVAFCELVVSLEGFFVASNILINFIDF